MAGSPGYEPDWTLSAQELGGIAVGAVLGIVTISSATVVIVVILDWGNHDTGSLVWSAIFAILAVASSSVVTDSILPRSFGVRWWPPLVAPAVLGLVVLGTSDPVLREFVVMGLVISLPVVLVSLGLPRRLVPTRWSTVFIALCGVATLLATVLAWTILGRSDVFYSN